MTDLGLSLRTSGRAPRDGSVEVVRALDPSDLMLLDLEKGVSAKPLQRLRDSHHALARLLAGGARPMDASAITGYSASRISILLADPAFQELLAHYRSVEAAEFASVQERMNLVNLDLIGELQDRLAEDPKSIDTETVIDGIKVLSDRTGHGPASKSTNLNVNVDLAGRVARADARVERLRAVRPILEGEVESASTLPPPVQKASADG